MKKILIISILLVLSIGCSNNKRSISTHAFKKAYEESKIINSMKSYTIQKPEDGYICILKKEISLYDKSRWKESEICSAIESLDKEMKEELELFNPPKQHFYSLEEYEKEHGTKSRFIGDERIDILKDNTLMKKKYSYALKKTQTIMLNHSVNDISKILKNEKFFNEHKKIFDPFDASSLSRIIYHNNKALVSFGLPTDEHSFLFGDYILELKEEKIIVYTLAISGACG